MTSLHDRHSAKESDVYVSPDRLLDFATAAYCACGMPEDDARIAADTLVQADLWGHQSHGVMRLPWYARRLGSGVTKPNAGFEILSDIGAITVVDGRDGMGQVLAARGMDEAIRRAKAYGIGAVSLRNSNHFGTAMYFTLKAAAQQCVAFLATNASPAMAPWGGREKSVGTNPWSWAAPAGTYAPMVLDIANTQVARGKIYLAKQRGIGIPPGWAMNKDGEQTIDPAAALDGGVVLPMAEHKGYAIAVLMDVLSGVLSGSRFGPAVFGPYQAEHVSGVGQLIIVLNIEAFQPVAEFGKSMEDLIGVLKAGPLAKGATEILYPGEMEARNETRNRRAGLMLPAQTISDLTALADALDLRSILPL